MFNGPNQNQCAIFVFFFVLFIDFSWSSISFVECTNLFPSLRSYVLNTVFVCACVSIYQTRWNIADALFLFWKFWSDWLCTRDTHRDLFVNTVFLVFLVHTVVAVAVTMCGVRVDYGLVFLLPISLSLSLVALWLHSMRFGSTVWMICLLFFFCFHFDFCSFHSGRQPFSMLFNHLFFFRADFDHWAHRNTKP